LGYISRGNPYEISTISDYEPGDLIGRSGIEKQYEKILRGKKGVKYLQTDRFSKAIGPYKEGIYDTLPDKGKDLTLSIDMDLQAYGEMLMQEKRGGIVAIEPATGEILSLVTAPSYDPSLLVGRKRSENFSKIWNDNINNPLLDRSLTATYPPGSTFKPISGAIALQEGVINRNTKISCHNGFSYGRRGRMRCAPHSSPLSIIGATAQSCNTFFAKSYWWTIDNYQTPQEGMDTWKDYLASFGLGDFLGYNLPTGRPRFIPSGEYYNRAYNYPTYRWSATYTLSNGIGQGEVLTTPIQLANLSAIIANRGWYYTPHLLRKVDGEIINDEKYTTKKQSKVEEKHFEPIVEGMHQVYEYG